MESSRTCTKCGESKPLSEYYTDKRWGIPYARCKRCHMSQCKPVLYVPITEARIRKFWTQVHTAGPMDCWEWTGRTFKGGYGVTNRIGSTHVAHRIAWSLCHGPIPDGLLVLHHCDNPPCCNPVHLFIGTDKDNVQDAKAKGRLATGDRSGARLHPELLKRGSAHRRSKLTEGDIPVIRALLADKMPLRTIGARYGVDSKTIHALKVGRTWTHVP